MNDGDRARGRRPAATGAGSASTDGLSRTGGKEGVVVALPASDWRRQAVVGLELEQRVLQAARSTAASSSSVRGKWALG
jgi:hypothetical protein